MTNVYKYALLNAAGAIAYIVGIVTILQSGKFFDFQFPELFAAVFMLTLLVISVASMGLIVFGRPVLWYLDGKKKDAVMLAVWTVVFMAIFALTLFACLIIFAPHAPQNF